MAYPPPKAILAGTTSPRLTVAVEMTYASTTTGAVYRFVPARPVLSSAVGSGTTCADKADTTAKQDRVSTSAFSEIFNF